VWLRAGSGGFRDGVGAALDGDGDGHAGGDYRGSFTVAADSGVLLSLPDFARGPGQNVDIPATGAGLPIRISSSGGVTGVSLRLDYDPALLDVSGASLAPGLTGNLVFGGEPGHRTIEIAGLAGLGAGTRNLLLLDAAVPDAAPYLAKQVIGVSQVQINGGALDGRGEQAVQLVGYLGDIDGSGGYELADKDALARLITGRDGGLAAAPSVDPLLAADIDGDGVLNGRDNLILIREIYAVAYGYSHLDRPEIPDLPGVTVNHGGGDGDLAYQTAGGTGTTGAATAPAAGAGTAMPAAVASLGAADGSDSLQLRLQRLKGELADDAQARRAELVERLEAQVDAAIKGVQIAGTDPDARGIGVHDADWRRSFVSDYRALADNPNAHIAVDLGERVAPV
jgi:hypothetical protein